MTRIPRSGRRSSAKFARRLLCDSTCPSPLLRSPLIWIYKSRMTLMQFTPINSAPTWEQEFASSTCSRADAPVSDPHRRPFAEGPSAVRTLTPGHSSRRWNALASVCCTKVSGPEKLEHPVKALQHTGKRRLHRFQRCQTPFPRPRSLSRPHGAPSSSHRQVSAARP